MQDLVDEVWHNKRAFSSLEQDAYGMALQGLHKKCSGDLRLSCDDWLRAF
jgi:hypothetical protein